jgi:superfamily II DNA or RNA helicase/HKD family nuclease
MADSVLNLPDDTRMLDVVREGLATADDVRIAVSFTLCSGLGLLIDPLKELADRGGRARILTSTYQSVTQPAALDTLLALPGVEARVQHGPVGFHTKFWWFGGEHAGECWAGSSNLSKGGLTTNLEWNLRAVDPATLTATRAQFEGLWTRPDVSPVTAELIRRYEQAHRVAASAARRPRFDFVADYGDAVRPNPAQVEALAQLAALRARGERRGAVIAATGVGKTFLAAFDVAASGARNVLYVSHRLEHLTQARRAFGRVLGATHSLGLVGGGSNESYTDIVFVTVASLANRPELAARAFDYLVIDEFHHVEAPSYEVLRPIRERAFLLGITATPERQDGHDVLEWCDWNVAYEVRLPEAIDRGWLLPFHYFGIADETVDFLQIPWRRLADVESALSVEARVEHVLQHALERGFDGVRRATVGFCAGRDHARYMATQFNKRGHVSVAVLGDSSVERREDVYGRLADVDDPLEWVFVSDILNEGVDIPAINSVLFLRPTESSTLFLQQLGRGLRLCPDTGVLTVLDFVGHHRSAWLTLEALHAPQGGGRREVITDGFAIKPPKACEVVLQRRTREILAKVSRFKTKKAACDEAYGRLRDELGRPVRPVDLWNRKDVPDFATFRAAHKTWLRCQEANDDAPPWAAELAVDHPVRSFLKAVERDWQAQRVWPYALLWGLCASPDDPAAGFQAFFERWSQWRVEQAELDGGKAWSSLKKKLGDALVDRRLAPGIRAVLGDALLPEVEGRLLATLAADHQTRHGGVLRTPDDLNLFAEYTRPEVVRHFGVHFDPAKHNKGILWFGDDAALILKLDTSGAVERHQYKNRLLAPDLVLWTSQNQMGPDNKAGRRVLDSEGEGRTLRLFVQPKSHAPALYLGTATVVSHEGSKPMAVRLRLSRAVPPEVLDELGVAFA